MACPLHPWPGHCHAQRAPDLKMMPSYARRLTHMPLICRDYLVTREAYATVFAPGTAPFAGGVLGDKRNAGDGLAWVPLIGGVGAKRPAS